MSPEPGITRDSGSRGATLPLAMLLILLLAALYTLAIDRTLAERNHVLNFYYENVALDLAESGINLATDKIQIGSHPTFQPLYVDEFRGLKGSINVEVEKISDDLYQITSIGRLEDKSGNIAHSLAIKARGRLDKSGGKRILFIEEWKELPADR